MLSGNMGRIEPTMKEQTLVQIVENFHRRGSETAFVYRRGYRVLRWSYRDVAESACRLAGELGKRGIRQGDRILLWGDDCAEWVVSFFGCVLRGAIVVPMDRTAALDFVQRVSRQVEPKLCIASREQPQIDPAVPSIAFEDLPDLIAAHSTSPGVLPDLTSEDIVEIGAANLPCNKASVYQKAIFSNRIPL
jgi:long-chain acyl-CoA synthetase